MSHLRVVAPAELRDPGVAATVRDGDIAGRSAAQLAINLAGIVVLLVRGFADRRHWHTVG